ncbi:hypothetical protein BKA80DRAFT_266721 [Phyllosticta citrichinensis]
MRHLSSSEGLIGGMMVGYNLPLSYLVPQTSEQEMTFSGLFLSSLSFLTLPLAFFLNLQVPLTC